MRLLFIVEILCLKKKPLIWDAQGPSQNLRMCLYYKQEEAKKQQVCRRPKPKLSLGSW